MTDLLKFVALVLGFVLWAALGYLKMVPLDPLIALLQMGLGGLITHMLQASSPAGIAVATAPAAPAAAPPGQGGFATIGFLGLIATIAFAALLTGCATFDGPLENRVACTVAKDKAFIVSQYGPVGVTGQIADADKQVICK